MTRGIDVEHFEDENGTGQKLEDILIGLMRRFIMDRHWYKFLTYCEDEGYNREEIAGILEQLGEVDEK